MSETAFDRAIARVFAAEGGYVNDAADRGGATRWGITQAVARANGYEGPMSELPAAWARSILRDQYWDLLRLEAVARAAPAVAEEVFDTAVNMGAATAATFLQAALNAFNRQGADYPDVEEDGLVGPMTIFALRQFLFVRGEAGEVVLLRALNAQQGARYLAIARNDRAQERFVYGWFRGRVA